MGFDIAPPDDMIDDKWYYCTVIAFEDPFAEGCFDDTGAFDYEPFWITATR